MKNSITLFLEINKTSLVFIVGEHDAQNVKITYKEQIPIIGVENNRVTDYEKLSNVIKENIYKIEQNFKYTFKELVIILENFDPSFINITGYKKLNSSQILRENVTYILNSLKSYVDKVEDKKTIIHIFNSKYYLDFKKVENLPIGLFGDFYSHELSFALIKKNDYKNLNNIFERCNLKIKKILLKSFIVGANISDNNKNLDTFFQIQINENNSKLFFFENNSLKYEQGFQFGSNIIINDIVKITSLKKDTIIMILDNIESQKELLKEELIEEKFFKNDIYRKIKKRLIYDIAFSRIQEILEIILFKNINIQHYIDKQNDIFLEINKVSDYLILKDIYKTIIEINYKQDLKFLENSSYEKIINTAFKLVHFGWNKEAIPITQPEKSRLARFFDALFG
jgi:cell division protein FtsA